MSYKDVEGFIERRKCPVRTVDEAQIEEVARRAAEYAVKKMVDDVFADIGKTIISKVLWFIGLVTVGAMMYFQSKGFFIK